MVNGNRTLIFFFLLSMLACSSEETSISQTGQFKLPDKVDFNFHIRPILADRCFACHGPDKNKREADLALYTKEGAFAALDSTHTKFPFVAGHPQKSEAYRRITSKDPEFMMPPPESNLSLTEAEKKLIKKWIEQGAEWKEHWAYIAPVRPALPVVSRKDWPINGIDYFVLRRLDELGLKPSSQATKEQLIRRVTFDLTGLPPSIQEMQDFLADDSSGAYEKVVDRLLNSPHYGERMAVDWLDVARYADSHGYQDDRPRTMWPWRDWVIRAFNQNMPYDVFVRDQLAGDLLPDAGYEQKLATGFNRNHAITQEGGVINEEYLTEYAADRAQTFSTAFIGQTLQCARCHDHKYDPFSQEDYYQLLAFFNNIQGERGQISYFDEAPVPNMVMQDTAHVAKIEAIRQMINDLERDKEAMVNQPSSNFLAWKKLSFKQESIQAGLDEGLAAWFRLDEMESWNFNNQVPGSSTGRVNVNLPPEIDKPTRVEGVSGKALQFNGYNFLSLGDIGDFGHWDPFSFGGWMLHTGIQTKEAAIFSRRCDEQKRQGYQLALTTDDRLSASLIADNQYYIRVESIKGLPKGKWNHIFITYDGSGRASGIKLFINGDSVPVKIVQDQLEGNSIFIGNEFTVGNWNQRARELKDLYGLEGGAVDEVRVYNRLLDPLEVKLLAGKSLQQPAVDDREVYLHYLLHVDTAYRSIENKLYSLRSTDLTIPSIMVMQEMDTLKKSFLLERGAYDAPTKEVYRSTPRAILTFNKDLPANRQGLAQWLFLPENPLTARVFVNRLWQMCFGTGIVSTADDFGSQGDLPSHPELLDWLAIEFRQSHWDIKAILKKIILSSTYRQSAVIDPQKHELDPKNKWLSRGPSVRLSAEMLRDQALAAGGLLHAAIGGKWVKPYQPPGIWEEMANQIGENKYRPGKGNDLYRRSLYTYWKRTIPPPTLLTFDASERAVCTVKRQATSTPLQSLILLNGTQYVEASRSLAENLLRQTPFKPADCIAEAFRKILSRTLQPQEAQPLLDFYEKEKTRLTAYPESAKKLLAVGEKPYDTKLPAPELAAMTMVVSTIMNLDEAKFK